MRDNIWRHNSAVYITRTPHNDCATVTGLTCRPNKEQKNFHGFRLKLFDYLHYCNTLAT